MSNKNTPISEATKSETSSINSSDPNAVKIGDGDDEDSTFYNSLVILELPKIGKLDDLQKFRSISEEYYDILNPIFHNYRNSTISIETPLGPVNSSSFLQIYSNQTKDRKITNASWTNEMACMFRNLWVSDIQPPETSFPNEISTRALITQLTPYITHLKLTCFHGLLDRENSTTQLPTFVKQFENLKKLQIRYLVAHCSCCCGCLNNDAFKPIPVPDLKTALENIDSTIQIELIVEVESKLREIAEGLGSSMKNLSIIFKSRNSLPPFRHFQLFWNDLGGLTNVTFDMPITMISDMAYLREYAQLSFQYQDRIKKLELILILNDFNEGEEEVRAQLMILSNVLTKLVVSQNKRQDKLNLWTNDDNNWPKLQSLNIIEYDRPLDILRNCPKLMNLALQQVDLSSCILYNEAQSPEDILEEYFGNKPYFASLTISGTVNYLLGHKLGGKSGLETLLRKVLPKGVRIDLDKLDFEKAEIAKIKEM